MNGMARVSLIFSKRDFSCFNLGYRIQGYQRHYFICLFKTTYLHAYTQDRLETSDLETAENKLTFSENVMTQPKISFRISTERRKYCTNKH
jgi:hypothetical protein